ncbi:tail protein X [Xenorhabdus mauleonii]|uniref:Tail protein X n=1 Tax=Xenorhabdus mauleonii TaxID=351675 RepID=A0A1I3XHU7_9GAMM|nr:tail protein X [Xenorhabdus mauleonii]PHM36201.1 tail protein X [Xenorhabdus mauleonii]SFK18919.1 P2-like prophage tail protein X [Xenorhabdus mauleonii]
MRVRTQQHDTVDSLCWRHYGRTHGVTEQVLDANPGLADWGAILPHGTEVELPDITAAPVTPMIQLWD